MRKLPSPPSPEALRALGADLVAVARHTDLVRVHNTAGPHVVPWNQLRHYGPVYTCRFDPHVPPPRHQEVGVSYFALDLPSALAEKFQETRVVNRIRKAPHVTIFRPNRVFRLLDLTGRWPIRAGASHTINTGPRDVCREWARAFASAWPDLDGLWHVSSMTGDPLVALFTPAADAFPRTPLFSEPLSHPGMTDWVAQSCQEINYLLL